MSDKRLTVLLVDDDPEIAQVVTNYLPPERYRVEVVGDGDLVESTVKHLTPDVVLLDVHLPSANGLEILKQLKSEETAPPVIIVSGYISTNNAIEAMKEGASEYLTKPFRMQKLVAAIERACGRPAGAEPRSDEDVIPTDDTIIGKSPEMVAVAKMIGQVASAAAPVLIVGDTGTGKELIARAIHRNSNRVSEPFVVVSCAASTESYLESELFGSGGASFPMRRAPVRGKLEEAGGGTVFLDEVADLPPAIQARLLRVIEDGAIERSETNETVPIGARIVAATSKSLVEDMKEGRFRVDLYYKLKVISMYLPCLRERRSDIPLLSEFFIRKYSRLSHRPPKPLSAAARDLLMSYHWPGNVGELENAIHTAVVLSRDTELGSADFPMLSETVTATDGAPSMERDQYRAAFRRVLTGVFDQPFETIQGRIYGDITEALDEALIEAALEATGGNQVRAAQLLGISRNTLRDRVKRFAIPTP